jgi:multidrug resistance efflux pump
MEFLRPLEDLAAGLPDRAPIDEVRAVLQADPDLVPKLAALDAAYDKLQAAQESRISQAAQLAALRATQSPWDAHLADLAADITSAKLSFGQ